MPNDIRATLTIKNNLLYKAIMRQHKSVARFCIENDLGQGIVGSYLNFKTSPLTKKRTTNKSHIDGWNIKQSAINIAEALGVNFLEIFPPVSYETKQNKFVAELDSQSFLPYDDTKYFPILEEPAKDYGKLYEFLNILSIREKDILSDRFGLNGTSKTLKSCAIKHDVTRERIRQIETKALQKLRQHERADHSLRKSYKGVNNSNVC